MFQRVNTVVIFHDLGQGSVNRTLSPREQVEDVVDMGQPNSFVYFSIELQGHGKGLLRCSSSLFNAVGSTTFLLFSLFHYCLLPPSRAVNDLHHSEVHRRCYCLAF